MVIKEFFSVPILSVVAGSSVTFRSPVVERFHCTSGFVFRKSLCEVVIYFDKKKI